MIGERLDLHAIPLFFPFSLFPFHPAPFPIIIHRHHPRHSPRSGRSGQSQFMSSKEKPTLGGVRIKTRKRNIAAPLDPSTFADAITQIYIEHDGNLELVAKDIEASELDFSRYGDTFFEVVFTGSRSQPGSIKSEGDRQPYAILNCEAARQNILPNVLFLQKIIRRRPFLIKNLENVMRRLLQSLELFEQDDRYKLAIFTALTFSQKLSGLPPETIFSSLQKDNLIAKGTVLGFLTEVFKEYLVENSLDDLIALLKRAKIEDQLLEFFPMQKRTSEAFAEHFSKEGLGVLVDYYTKKVVEEKLKEMKTTLTNQIGENVDMAEVKESLKQRCKEANLPELDVVRKIWEGLMDAVQWSGKNQQQNANLALKQVATWGKLLGEFCTTAKLQLELMYTIQTYCYEDAKIMKLYPEIIRALYDQDVLVEDTILLWFRKGTNVKGRQTFVKGLEPFVKWLEEAEEED